MCDLNDIRLSVKDGGRDKLTDEGKEDIECLSYSLYERERVTDTKGRKGLS